MKVKDIIICVVVSILSFLIVYFTNTKEGILLNDKTPLSVYRVYLKGRSIGLIESKEEFENYFNKKQEQIKKKYNVDSIFIPNDIDIVRDVTYDNNLSSIEDIYKVISSTSPFTIKAYKVVVNRENSTDVQNDENIGVERENETVFYVLDKDMLTSSIKQIIYSFVDEDKYDAFIKNNQVEITSVGEILEDVYLEEEITVTECNVPVDQDIYIEEDALVNFMLFGAVKENPIYVVKAGEDLDTIALKHKVSVNTLVASNKSINNSNALLSVGQEIEIGIINPIFNIVIESHIVEDLTDKYTTEFQYTNSMYTGQQKEIQAGINGTTRVVKKVKSINGETIDTIITGSEVLVPTVNRIVMKGGRAPARGDGEWFWPTNFPYSISSRYAYRCIFGTCRSHTGIDITGTGRGSPIYAARDGVVTKIEYNAGGLGYYVQIKHDNGYYTQYGHMCNANGGDSAGGTNSAYKYIKVGDRVKAGFRVGDMGSSGSSTGVHLHFEIWGGVPYQASSYDPLTFY